MIIKSDGKRVAFSAKKIRESLLRARAPQAVVDHVVSRVNAQVKDRMSTGALFALVRRELRRENRDVASRYNLRDGLLKLGPAGFNFEKYVAAILTAYDYKTEIPPNEIHGLCVPHEIDVVAEKDGKRTMIEAKYRNTFGDNVILKDVMATWARYQDLRDGYKAGKCPRFDEVWIVTNGRFSDRAWTFGTCKKMRLVGWRAGSPSLAEMVDHTALYPITVVDGLKPDEMDSLARQDYMLCREIAGVSAAALAKRTGIGQERGGAIIQACRMVVGADR